MKLSFHGAAGTVTGSRFLLESEGTRVLIDAGMFQGLKRLRELNWERPPFEPAALDAIVLTHAHIDHSGWLPLLVQQGFRGPVYCTEGTRDLLQLLLPDAAYLQEEDAKFANRRGYSRHQPAKPLYTRADVDLTLPLLEATAFDAPVSVGPLAVRFAPAGHIVGAACVRVEGPAGSVLFSGDVGRSVDPIMRPPRALQPADWLVLESTYGDRSHSREDTAAELARIATRVLDRGGTLLIPAFAVGRSQTLLHLLREGMVAGAIPRAPVFLDSPMAIAATEVFCRHVGEHRLSEEECRAICESATFVRQAEESKRLSASETPKIILSASGMATGGRVLHHLKSFAPERRNGILLVGYQAAGTRGEALARRTDELKIHGAYVSVEAEVFQLHGLSAHADRNELLDWLRPLPAPKRTFLVHGEPSAQQAFKVKLRDALQWKVQIPELGESVTLG